MTFFTNLKYRFLTVLRFRRNFDEIAQNLHGKRNKLTIVATNTIAMAQEEYKAIPKRAIADLSLHLSVESFPLPVSVF